ncbi:MAG: PP2C family protein-serine/threonine phosphatase [Eubacterium sp.]|nr:PP2C family protein-serine/threonine phosphatase [Eubacterium sp.]
MILKNKKNKKLLFQVGFITISVLMASLILISVFDLFYSKKLYLSSKEEMIETNLQTISDRLSDTNNLKWFVEYIKTHSEEISVPATDEEKELYKTDEYTDTMYNSIVEDDFNFDEQTPEMQLYLARTILSLMEVPFILLKDTNYEKVELLNIKDEHSAFMLVEFNRKDTEGNIDDDDDGIIKKNIAATIEYESSEHSAVKKILNGALDEPGATLFEEYYDAERGRHYYNGYAPVTVDGEHVFDLCLQYDWSMFRKNLFAEIIISFIIRVAILAALNALLLLFIYIKAVKPLAKVKRGVQKYRDDKDTSSVISVMNDIKARNEVGVLAETVSEMASEIDNYISIAAEKEKIETELNLAANIQLSALPSDFPAFPDRTEFDIYASMNPAKEVGGDFYDYFLVDEDHLAIVMADVSGKGVPAALFMMMSKMLIKSYTMMGHSPKSMLEYVNHQICSNNPEKMFVTVYIGILDLNTGEMLCGNAGHEYPVLKKPDGHFELYHDHHNFVVGGYDTLQYDEYLLKIEPGSKLFLYTDGLPDATDSNKNRFGIERAVEALRSVEDDTPKDILGALTEQVNAFVGDAPRFDDLAMLCLHFKGASQ